MNIPVRFESTPLFLKKPRFAKCRVHGSGKGYVACTHVLENGTPVGFLEHPGISHATLGTLLCDSCYESHPLNYDALKIACAQCVQDRGLNRPKAILAEPLIIN